MQEGHKQCSKCGESKVLSDFHANSRNKDGRAHRCKRCIADYGKTYRATNEEILLAKRQSYYATKKETVLAQQKEYYARNKEKIAGTTKNYRAKYKDRIAASKKTYVVANKEKVAAWFKAHRVANKESIAAKRREHRKTNKEIIAAKKRIRYLANKAEVAGRGKAYRAANKEKCATRRKIYHAANREVIRAWHKANYAAKKEIYAVMNKQRWETNREAILAQHKIYRDVNKERLADKKKEYLKTPIGRAVKKATYHKRRNRGQFAFDALVDARDFQQWEEHGAVCYLTSVNLLPGAVTWDHVVPLHWGGTSDRWNYLPASYSANSIKNNRIVCVDLTTREPRYTLDPCPGGVGPSGETWPRIPLTQPTLDEMDAMVSAWKERKKEYRHAA